MALLAVMAWAGVAVGQDRGAPRERFLHIGTGSITGTYYPIGGLIAGIVSSPPGARPCEAEGEGGCGVPGLIAIVQTSRGSVDNVEAIRRGESESGFVQSDVAYGAYTGTGVFAGQPPADKLRVLASLYRESVHLVAAPGAAIKGVPDLVSKRVSLDAVGSGSLVGARLVLDAFGIGEAAMKPVYLPLSQSLPLLRRGELDALFVTAGYPAPAVAELVDDAGARLVPIVGPPVDRLLDRHRFFARDVIPGGVYPGMAEGTPTIGVAALWVASADLDEELAYELVRALWHPNAREALDTGHPKGRDIHLEMALRGVAIPVHPGAARFYREQGVAEGE